MKLEYVIFINGTKQCVVSGDGLQDALKVLSTIYPQAEIYYIEQEMEELLNGEEFFESIE